MFPRSTDVSDSLRAYMYTTGIRENSILKALGDETAKLPNASWATTPEQGAFLQMLVRLIQARRVIEIGTFTGYAALAMALAALDIERKRDVVADQLEMWVVQKMRDIVLGAGKEVIEAQNIRPRRDQLFTEMRT